MGTNMGPPNQHPPVSMQFRPMAPIPPQQPAVPPFAPVNTQQYQPVGHPNMGMQLPPPPIQYHPAMQPPFQHPSSLQPPLQHPMRPPPQALTPGHVHPQGLAVAPPDMQLNRPVMPGSGPPLGYNNMMPNSGGPRFSHVHPVQMAPTTSQAEPPNFPVPQPWYPNVNQQMQMVLPTQQVVEQQKGEQDGYATQIMTPNTSSVSNGDQNAEQNQVSNANTDLSSGTHSQPTGDESASLDYVKGIPEDSEKRNLPDWGEYTSPQGKKYYYNKKTRISSWEKPLELMTPTERADASTDWREVTTPDGRRFYHNKVTRKSTWAVPDEIKLARERANLAFSEETTASNVVHVLSLEPEVGGTEAAVAHVLSAIQEDIVVSTSISTPVVISQIEEHSYEKNLEKTTLERSDGTFASGDVNTPERKNVDHGQSAYESKEDAKIAFRALLETVNIGFDWTWDQAMRVIINDRRYGALKSLGERKQAFNEEEMRRAERKNRDEFRKLMEEHATSGFLTVNSHWRDYAMKVKENPAYISISSNTSGPTAKDLFDDVIEDLEKQYMEDKERVEEVMMSEKICLEQTWTLEDFRSALPAEGFIKRISDVNMKIIFNELLEFKKEREGKEAKRRKRHADDVYDFLLNLNELTSSSRWEDYRAVVEERFTGEESFLRDIFDRVIEKLKEKEKKRREGKKYDRRFKENKEEKDRRNKDGRRSDKERRKVEEMDSEGSKSSSFEEKKRSRDMNKRYGKHDGEHGAGDMSQDDEKYQSRSRRHTGETTKLKQDKHMEVDSETESKKQKRDDHWNPPGMEHQNFEGAEEGEVR